MDRNDGSLEVFQTAVLIYKKARKPQIFRYSELSATGQKSYIIAAPIEIKGGDNKGEYWMGVVVKSNAESQRMYTHDVVAIKKESFDVLKTGTNFEEIRYPGGNKASITTILQKLSHVKYVEDVKRSTRDAADDAAYAKEAKAHFGKTYSYNKAGYNATDCVRFYGILREESANLVF